MPGYLRVRVSAGRNTDTTDAYVEIKFGSTVYKTSVCRKSLNPQWNNSEWYTFEVEDYELQDEPLQLRLMDHDTYSANDAIGKVVISLSPLLPTHTGDWQDGDSTSRGGTMSGWLPVLDPLRGVRGELYVVVKVELFTDFNRFRQSSCGVSFFHCPAVPPGYYASTIHGFVDEQIVNSDPEYQWIDKIRTVRASNEARHLAFTNISGRVQRLIGLKAAELGANAVLGYQQSLDIQGEAGVVARASATAVTLHRCSPVPPLEPAKHNGVNGNTANDPTPTSEVPRRSSDSEIVNKAPQMTTLQSSSGSKSRHGNPDVLNKMSAEMLEYPFITMIDYPPDLIVRLGGTVCARSVKLLSSGGLEGGGASGAAWWSELRTELRSHARSLRCTAVLGYTESVTIHEDICILSAMGTAAVISINNPEDVSSLILDDGPALSESMKENPMAIVGLNGTASLELGGIDCLIAHAPYNAKSVPYRADICMCEICGGGHVPRVLLATIAPPHGLNAKECEAPLLASAALRTRRSSEGEAGARDVSDVLPFVEYELHRALLSELRARNANAVFGLRVSLSLGERHVVALATGTAYVVAALPPSSSITVVNPTNPNDEQLPSLELGDACAVEVEQETDCVPNIDDFVMAATTQRPVGQQAVTDDRSDDPPRMFFRLWRGRLTAGNSANPNDASSVTTAAISLVKGARYKLRAKGILRDVRYSLYLPETPGAVPDEVQILVTGVAVSPSLRSGSISGRIVENGNGEKPDEEHSYNKEDGVILTPLPTIHGMKYSRHIGALRLIFVRESTAARDQFVGGLAGFVHAFMTEVLCSVRAHVAALGGNAVTSLTISEMMLQENPHKNHGQCLISIGGDVVTVH